VDVSKERLDVLAGVFIAELIGNFCPKHYECNWGLVAITKDVLTKFYFIASILLLI